MSLSAAGDWKELQIKIFSRWVNQKLATHKVKMETDVVHGFSDGVNLVHLVEIMSEKKMEGKALTPQTVRVKQIDGAARALQFTLKECGVKTELPPSTENLVDGEEKSVMGLVWAIMMRFLKFSDDAEEANLSAEDALLMWVNNQIFTYKLAAKDFTKSFHDGKIYAALIHKNRPRLIHPDQLNGTNEENIAKVLDAAHLYFGLEKYLQPADVGKLDSKSAFVFCCEFFYGIAAQRKKDLAARRIAKLIDYTKVNDKLRAEYKALASAEAEHVVKVNAILSDRTIDNTMAGAKAKLEQYYKFKKDDKGVIVGNFLKLEALKNHLSMRLEDGKRPAHNPGAGLDVPDFRASLDALEKLESERGVELIAELNRQNYLVKLNHFHQARFNKLKTWVAAKQAYLGTKEVVESSGAADFQLNRLASYDDEAAAVAVSTVADMNKLGAELKEQKYEGIAEVTAHEAEIAAAFTALEAASAHKNVILTDDLARNKYKEAIHLVALKHLAKYQQIKAWVEEKRAYLSTAENINSVNEAQLALSALDSFEADKKDLEGTPIPALKVLGKEIIAAEYKSDHSSWAFEKPEDIKSREAEIDSACSDALPKLSAAKRGVLEADLAREIEKERLRLLFANQAGALVRWSKSLVEDLDDSVSFGIDLDEVKASKGKIDEEDKKNVALANTRNAKAKETLEQGSKLGVKENPYTQHTAEELDAAVTAITAAQTARGGRYDAELARVTEDDNLCKQLADLANPLVATIAKNKSTVNESKDALDAQLKAVEDFLAANFGAEDSKKITELQGSIDSRGVTKNKHTQLTAQDVLVHLEQYAAFLNSKQAQIKEQIRINSLRGITAEQMAEIDVQFKRFDKNDNKMLDKQEFKACLYSLGEERPTTEVMELIKHYGDGKNVSYDGFKAFMMKLFGDNNTQPEIADGFKLLADDAPAVAEKQLTDVFQDLNDVEYLKENVEKDGDKLKYPGWVEAVFAR